MKKNIKKNLYLCDFVYCIDKNFNKQAYLSIASLCKTTPYSNFQIHIIHKKPKSFTKFLTKLNTVFPEINIKVIKFKYNIKSYPNLKRAHVSEATYYRMFIEDHLENPSDFITYIDADAYFINDVTLKLSNIINKLYTNNILLAAKTEIDSNNSQSFEVFKRLNIKEKYFNAGVMVVNLKKWKKENVSQILVEKVSILNTKIKFWDQDVLNSVINGKYYELPPELNFLIDIYYPENLSEKKIDIIHYAGKIKPWSKTGVELNPSTYYQKLNDEF